MILLELRGLNVHDWRVMLVDIILIICLLSGIYDGYKKGFLESTIKFIGTIISLIGAYMFKNPVSVFLYSHLPFFKLGGAFKGVTVINILIYEFIAFIIVFIGILLVLSLIYKLTGIVQKIFSVIAFLGLPNKILGALVGFVETVIILYFVCFLFVFITNFFGYKMKESFVDVLLDVPVLKETFGPSLNSVNDIVILAKDYHDVQDKDEYNYKALEILLKYDIITKENVKKLVDDKKINIPNVEVLLN